MISVKIRDPEFPTTQMSGNKPFLNLRKYLEFGSCLLIRLHDFLDSKMPYTESWLCLLRTLFFTLQGL